MKGKHVKLGEAMASMLHNVDNGNKNRQIRTLPRFLVECHSVFLFKSI